MDPRLSLHSPLFISKQQHHWHDDKQRATAQEGSLDSRRRVYHLFIDHNHMVITTNQPQPHNSDLTRRAAAALAPCSLHSSHSTLGRSFSTGTRARSTCTQVNAGGHARVSRAHSLPKLSQ